MVIVSDRTGLRAAVLYLAAFARGTVRVKASPASISLRVLSVYEPRLQDSAGLLASNGTLKDIDEEPMATSVEAAARRARRPEAAIA
jgi:hypothetical protein